MLKSRLDRLLAPWVFVLTGILFNVLSAVITHYFIGLNNDDINDINERIEQKQVLIDSLWQSRIEVERKEEFLLLYLGETGAMTRIRERYFRDYLQHLVDTHDLENFRTRVQKAAADDAELLLELSDAALATIIESINNTYFETLELREARMPLERANSRLFSIAIFLQVIGLILVLSRDLRRS